MAILGTLVASLVVARSRALHQLADADRRQDAVIAADELLSGWWAQPAEIPVGSSGPLTGGMQWQTSPLNNPVSKQLGIRIVRLQIVEAGGHTAAPSPLASVDFLMDLPPAKVQGGQ